ncbi:hypothetical protein AB8B21_02975 [Tardiphaga sp. 866_E4_N2_1]|uniref:hypothetical protein n=1 Tax=unclassified Tardiphaga TaxID=2631404 RepID=UPI003F23F335
MAKALEEQRRLPDLNAQPFEERVGLLVDREAAERDTSVSPPASNSLPTPKCLRGRYRPAHPRGIIAPYSPN